MATATRTRVPGGAGSGSRTSALDGLNLVNAALDRTLEAVEHQDVELAELVIADDDVIDGRYLEVHQSRSSRCWPRSRRWRPTCA